MFKQTLGLLMMLSTPVLAVDPTSWFITKEGKPTERLKELLELDNLYSPEDNLAQIVAKTQNAWVQTNQGANNKERTDLVDSPEQLKKKRKIEQIVEELGLFEAKDPQFEHYNYGVVNGAFLDGVKHRISLLINYWERGYKFDKVVVLTGDRKLRKEAGQEDDPKKLKKMPENVPYENEYDMCKLIWEETDFPDDMKERVVFVNAPAPQGKARPSTKDCFVTWLQTNPQPGKILATSHPVVWTYQQLAGQNSLPSDFLLDTCAKAADQSERQKYEKNLISIIQDTVAKCLYEINISVKK